MNGHSRCRAIPNGICRRRALLPITPQLPVPSSFSRRAARPTLSECVLARLVLALPVPPAGPTILEGFSWLVRLAMRKRVRERSLPSSRVWRGGAISIFRSGSIPITRSASISPAFGNMKVAIDYVIASFSTAGAGVPRCPSSRASARQRADQQGASSPGARDAPRRGRAALHPGRRSGAAGGGCARPRHPSTARPARWRWPPACLRVVLGQAVYDIAAHHPSRPLDSFWANPRKPDRSCGTPSAGAAGSLPDPGRASSPTRRLEMLVENATARPAQARRRGGSAAAAEARLPATRWTGRSDAYPPPPSASGRRTCHDGRARDHPRSVAPSPCRAVLHPSATGVDRVEMALCARPDRPRAGAAALPRCIRRALRAAAHGRGAALPRAGPSMAGAERERPRARALRRAAMAALAALRPRIVPPGQGRPRLGDPSPSRSTSRSGWRRSSGGGALRLPFVHDLILSTIPNIAAASGGQTASPARGATIAAHAGGIVANRRRRSLDRACCKQPVARRVDLLGADDFVRAERAGGERAPRPYFLVHRHDRAAQEPPAAAQSLGALRARSQGHPPRLVLVGRRGWENENVVDTLERCPGLAGLVEERGTVARSRGAPADPGARALLLPSFAEGYGMPVAEALAMGTPSSAPTCRRCARRAERCPTISIRWTGPAGRVRSGTYCGEDPLAREAADRPAFRVEGAALGGSSSTRCSTWFKRSPTRSSRGTARCE